jgi:hypothetical protein
MSRNCLLRLHAEILADLKAAEGVAAKALEVRGDGAQKADEKSAMALAGFLHHFYTGLESIFERIALAFEGSLPQGPHWHRDLLRSMAIEILRVRPAVLRQEYAPLLIGFLNELGAKVVLSSKTTKHITEESTELGYTDSCFPVKLLHGHADASKTWTISSTPLPSVWG